MKYKLMTLFLGSCFLMTSCDKKATDADSSSDTKANSSAKEIVDAMEESPEAAADAMASLYDQMSEALEGIKDKESAEKALKEVSSVAGKMSEMAKLADDKEGEDVPAEVQDKLMKIMQPSMERFQEAMKKALPTFTKHPELMGKFQVAMSKVGQ